jgi:hypothetical protein
VGRRAAKPVAGVSRKLKVKLSDDIARDLWAFCEVHHGAPHNRVIESAVRRFIEEELAQHPTLATEWRVLRQQLEPGRPTQIVKFPAPDETP